MRTGVLLDFFLRNEIRSGWGSLDHSKNEIEFRILHGRNRVVCKIATLDFKRVNFGLFKDLFGGILWIRLLKGLGAQERWLIFKHNFQ